MSLPAQIAVKYTEEEAEYLSVRPVRRLSFQLAELVDMVLGVTGKDLPRIQQILHSGTIVFNFYRYWWEGFDAETGELAAVLATFPDADPARPFRAEECTVVLLAGKSYQPPPGNISLPSNGVELRREELARKKLFSGKNLWDALMAHAKVSAPDVPPIAAPGYLGYSYLRRADVYSVELSTAQAASLARDAGKLAPRSLRAHLTQISAATHILFLCPRKT